MELVANQAPLVSTSLHLVSRTKPTPGSKPPPSSRSPCNTTCNRPGRPAWVSRLPTSDAKVARRSLVGAWQRHLTPSHAEVTHGAEASLPRWRDKDLPRGVKTGDQGTCIWGLSPRWPHGTVWGAPLRIRRLFHSPQSHESRTKPLGPPLPCSIFKIRASQATRALSSFRLRILRTVATDAENRFITIETHPGASKGCFQAQSPSQLTRLTPNSSSRDRSVLPSFPIT